MRSLNLLENENLLHSLKCNHLCTLSGPTLMTVHKIILNCLLPSVTETEFPLYDIKQSSDRTTKYISYIYPCTYIRVRVLRLKSCQKNRKQCHVISVKDLLVDPTLYSLK